MAHKRKAVEAFANTQSSGQLSAFAAARLAKQPKQVSQETELDVSCGGPAVSASTIAEVPYDGRDNESMLEHDVSVLSPPPPRTGLGLSLSSPGLRGLHTVQHDTNTTVVSLRSGQYVTIVGEYDIEVIKGAVSLYGAVLHPGSGTQRVFAPSTHALPHLTARVDESMLYVTSAKSGLRKLERLSPLHRNIWSDSLERSFTVLHTTSDDSYQRNLSSLEIGKPLQAVLSRVAAQTESNARSTRVMAIGAKSSGKSTFNRLLCNTITTRQTEKECLYLDLDPGQPEFGPPGMLSLVEVTTPILGPPFTHPASSQSRQYRMIRSHTIAATTFKDDPAHYLACARDLARHADRRYPLVVNSSGWVSGLGASVLLDLVTALSISDVVVLEPVEAALIESLQRACTDTAIHRLPRQPPRPSPRTPAESRNMQTMAYMHHRCSPSSQAVKWSGTPISAVRPWTVSYAGPDRGIYTIMSYGQEPSSEYLGEVLDGSLVAIVLCDDSSLTEAFVSTTASDTTSLTPDSLIRQTVEGLPYFVSSNNDGISTPLDPAYSQCVGLALIRGIDTIAKRLQLVTPLAEPEIATLMSAGKKVVLVRGSFDPPSWAYLEDIYQSGEERESSNIVSRPWVSKKDMVGIEGAVWRLRHPPMASSVR